MKNFLKYVLATVTGLIITFIIAGVFGAILLISVISAASFSKPEVNVKENTVLHLKFDHEISEQVSENPFDRIDFFRGSVTQAMSLKSIIDNIEKAKNDDNIKGIFLDLNIIPAGFATLQEIRNALLDFKNSDKFIYAYADSYMQGTYFIASLADSIYFNPEGYFWFPGLNWEIAFLRGALDKLEIEPKIIRAGGFKSAGETIELYKMSEENRLQLSEMQNSIYDNYLMQLSDSRGIETETLRGLAGEFKIRYSEDALQYGMVDVVSYRDEFLELLKDKTGAKKAKDINFIELKIYNRVSAPSSGKKGDKSDIALIYATGNIMTGEGGQNSIGSDKLSRTIRQAREDKDIKAIVLRVNSGGGSALASDIILREVKLAREVKPVIVSFGAVAASGGYFIAASADKIFAQPTSITGSIGVISMIMNMEKFWENKLGITFDRVQTGPYADLFNFNRAVREDEVEILRELTSKIYDDFLQIVANGRGMTVDEVHAIGQGRVWTGLQAKENGLIDELGGLNDAIASAAEMAEIEDYRIKVLPRPKKPFESLMEDFMLDIRQKALMEELGIDYEVFSTIKFLKNANEPMAIMPYEIRM